MRSCLGVRLQRRHEVLQADGAGGRRVLAARARERLLALELRQQALARAHLPVAPVALPAHDD
jgi:hypothetical protein